MDTCLFLGAGIVPLSDTHRRLPEPDKTGLGFRRARKKEKVNTLLNQQEREYFVEKCKDIRALTIDEIATLGVGHLGGCMSVVEIMVMLYYKHMNIDPKNPKMEGRDRLVLSKAHAGPTLYAILADKGYFDKSELKTLNQPGTHLPSHANMVLTTGVDMTAGSLGQGLSCATGAAIGS